MLHYTANYGLSTSTINKHDDDDDDDDKNCSKDQIYISPIAAPISTKNKLLCWNSTFRHKLKTFLLSYRVYKSL